MTKSIFSFLLALCISLQMHSQQSFRLNTQAGIFDPEPNGGVISSTEWSNIPEWLGSKYLMLQFAELPNTAVEEKLRDKQITLLTYLPPNTYYVKVPSSYEVSRFLEIHCRSVFAPNPSFKIHGHVQQGSVPAHAQVGQKVELLVTLYPGIPSNQVQDVLESQGAEIIYSYNQQHVVLQIEPKQVTSLASLACVQFINYSQAPMEKENTANRTDHRSNVLNTDYGAGRHYDGNNVRVALTDDGTIGPHIDYQGRTTQDAVIGVNNGNHGDHCAGTIMGAGNKDPLGRGMAPAVKLWVYNALSSNNYILDDSIYTSPSTSIDIVSTSYSDGCNDGYNSGAESADRQIRTYKNIMRVFSAGNNGTSDCSYGAGAGWGNITGGIKLAKNLITVANLDYMDVLASSSSRGPATDGRIKPDVSAVGTNVYSTIDPHDYALKSGTSMSCPGVSGLFAQLYQAYRVLHSGQDPHTALLKNILMNTCDDIGNPGPDFKHGYGRVNGLRAIKVLEAAQHVHDSVTTGNTKTITLNVPANTQRVKIMLNWFDREAAVSASIALVNDLDLKVTSPSNTQYYPWVLNPAPNATTLNANAQRLVDHLNNIEQVTIDTPMAGNYIVNVSGYAVPFGPQDYFISYEFIPFDSIEITYPLGGEGFAPSEIQTIRWNALPNGNTFSVDYTTNNGNSWTNISSTIPATQLFCNWNVPNNLSGQCKVRISRGSFSSSSPANFTIANIPTNLAIQRVCPDTITIRWSSTPGATAYDVFRLGNFYMDSVGTTTDTFFHFTNLQMGDEHWFSVRAINPTNNSIGRRAFAIQQVPGLVNCPLLQDAELISCENPGNSSLLSCTNDPVVVSATIKNSGINAISNFPISYQLNSSAAVTETYSGTILPGAQASYTFSTGISSLPVGNQILHIYTSLSGDNYPINDSIGVNLKVISSAVATLPWSEDFETTPTCTAVSTCDLSDCLLQNGLFNEQNGVMDNFDWKVFEGPTATANTGPDVDHTLGSATGNYIYTESSTCYEQTALMLSPCFTFTSFAAPYLSYWYHLYGNGQGSLNLDAFVDGAWQLNIIPTVSGDLGNTWFKQTVDLSAYAGKTIYLRWRGKTGINQRSDMAMDDFLLVDSNAAPTNTSHAMQGISIYPNPTSEYLDIFNYDKSINFDALEVYNAVGQMVYSADLIKPQYKTRVITTTFAKGMYHLVLRKNKSVVYRGKFVKE